MPTPSPAGPAGSTIDQERRNVPTLTPSASEQGAQRRQLQGQGQTHQSSEPERPSSRRLAALGQPLELEAGLPCYYPIMAAQPYPGARPLLFGKGQEQIWLSTHGKRFHVPCLQCSGCRRRSSLEWASRCMHEAQMHRYNTYITLTYNDAHLPPNASLVHQDWVRFLKRVRNHITRGAENIYLSDSTQLKAYLGLSQRNWNRLNSGTTAEPQIVPANTTPGRSRKDTQTNPLGMRESHSGTTTDNIRFYMAGEYGEKYGRPHYHALLFGMDFSDKLLHGRTKSGQRIYTSATLQELWPYGYSSLGNVTFASAAYISRYVMKKRTGDGNKTDYEILDLETGEIIKKKKEYNCMSRASGIGHTWLHKYHADVYTLDKVITKQGRELRPPRYYDKQFKKMDAARLEHLKHVRQLEAIEQKAHHTPERLAVQEIVANSQARFQRRNFE